jgi:hypothetical protein
LKLINPNELINPVGDTPAAMVLFADAVREKANPKELNKPSSKGLLAISQRLGTNSYLSLLCSAIIRKHTESPENTYHLITIPNVNVTLRHIFSPGWPVWVLKKSRDKKEKVP